MIERSASKPKKKQQKIKIQKNYERTKKINFNLMTTTTAE